MLSIISTTSAAAAIGSLLIYMGTVPSRESSRGAELGTVYTPGDMSGDTWVTLVVTIAAMKYGSLLELACGFEVRHATYFHGDAVSAYRGFCLLQI
jgi:hypothetical protein